MRIAFIGFGEAAQAFVEGWGIRPPTEPATLAAYDRKTDAPATRAATLADYARTGVAGADTLAQALAGAELVLSVVTADQALAAARAAAPLLASGALFCDLNSVAPDTKRAAAAAIEGAGACYADVAVMAPVRPALLDVPLLVAGPHGEAAQALFARLGLRARVVAGGVGAASAIKMVRSIMVKGLEALTAECLLCARAAGVEAEVLASLDASFPGWGWQARGDYNLDRMLVHGARRAAEMREASLTAAALGLDGIMAAATASWQDRLGALALVPPPQGFVAKADAVIAALKEGTHP